MSRTLNPSLVEALSAGATAARENPSAPMSPDERRVALALATATMLPGSWGKRFARDMAERAADPKAQLSARQREWLWRLCHQFRRQLPGDIADMAAECLACPQTNAEAATGPTAYPDRDDVLAGLLGDFLAGHDETLLIMADRCRELGQDAWAFRCLGWHATITSIEGEKRDVRDRLAKVAEAVRREFAACAEPLCVVEHWRWYARHHRLKFASAVGKAGLTCQEVIDGNVSRLLVEGPAGRGQRSKLRLAREWLESVGFENKATRFE